MSSTPIIIVTGANRGIGQALCHKILADPTLSAGGPLRLFATSRKGEDLGFQAQNPSSGVKVHYPRLDIGDSRSIRALADECGKGSVRALINNAGVNLDQHYGVENARKTMDVNFWGTLEVCRSIIMAAICCRLHSLCLPIKQIFADVSFVDVPIFHPAPGAPRPHRKPLFRRLKSETLQRERAAALQGPGCHSRGLEEVVRRVPCTSSSLLLPSNSISLTLP